MAVKRYYWIKLKDTFLTSDAVDFLMSQKNGANYVVLYQMLCLKTINTGGELSRKIGEIIIPFDVDKIHRDCKYFEKDTVVVALELYQKLGLVYENKDGFLQIANFDNLVGSETSKAEIMRRLREKRKKEALSGGFLQIANFDNLVGSETSKAEIMRRLREKRKKEALSGNKVTKELPESYPDVTQDIDIRDKILDTRYKSIDIDSIDVNKSAPVRTRKEIINYIKERCDIELQELICSRCYGNTEVLELVIDTIADILSSGESLSIKNNKINSEALYELVRGINNKQLSSIIQGFYQEKDGKWVRKQVSVPAKYIFTVLFNQADTRKRS